MNTVMITCNEIKHRWGESADGNGHVEIYYSHLPNGESIIHKRNPIPPDKPSITPPDRVGFENGWCEVSNEVKNVVQSSTTTAKSIALTTTSETSEPGMGAFFLLVIVITGCIALFQRYKQHSDREFNQYYQPTFEPNPFVDDSGKISGSTSDRYGDFIEQEYPPHPNEKLETGTLTEIYPTGKAAELAGYGGESYETPEIQNVSALKPPEISTETRLKQLETGIETILKRLEISESDTLSSSYFDLKDGATTEVVKAFCELVADKGLNPNGTDIIKRMWGVKPGGSKAYQEACELRDQLANRLKEFGSHEQ